LKGIVLNRVAGSRHESILRNSIEHFCGLPVIGAVPKLRRQSFPERHMGLVPTPEHNWALASIAEIGRTVAGCLDMDVLLDIARAAPKLQVSAAEGPASRCVQAAAVEASRAIISGRSPGPRIGILRDAAFQFYYPENLDALTAAGAELVYLSPLGDAQLPQLDALYIGGGFPETHAAELAANRTFAASLKDAVDDGLPVYAECGGLMYLGRELVLEKKAYPMAGVLPVVFGFNKRPQGHGYVMATVTRANPFYEVGTEIRGHEFHYSNVLSWSGDESDLVFRMQRGVGIAADRDGIVYKNVLATYIHVHALGTTDWAQALVRNARRYRDPRRA
jgi:cobyrinic acid a,c-diamide synthase